MSAVALQPYLEEFGRLRESGPGNWWMQAREPAIAAFRELGFPHRRQEEWKYTDVAPIAKRRFISSVPGDTGYDADLVAGARLGIDASHELVFINGHFVANLSQVRSLPNGIIVGALACIAADAPALLEPHLTRHADIQSNGFVALNTALMGDGGAIFIADGMRLDEPVHLLFLSTSREQPVAAYPRNLVVLGRNSHAAVLETHVGLDDGECLGNAVSEIVLGPGAALEYYKIVQGGKRNFHVGTTIVHQDRDSRLDSHSVSLGGALVRNTLDVHLAAPGAEAVLNGLYMARGREHVDNHTRIDHEQPRTRSVENYRGVLDGHARGVFNGKVVVHRDAQKTDASQANANLLLSDDAEVDTKPELEIYADDVKCSHGATVGRLDQDMMFYLRSRAIPENTARSLLTFAFADEVIAGMKLRAVRDRLEQHIIGRLPDAALIGEFVK